MTGPRTFVEHDILCLDAKRGIFYQNFDDFWEKRMEPMQFIPREAKGAFAHLREKLVESAREQFLLFDVQQKEGEKRLKAFTSPIVLPRMQEGFDG